MHCSLRLTMASVQTKEVKLLFTSKSTVISLCDNVLLHFFVDTALETIVRVDGCEKELFLLIFRSFNTLYVESFKPLNFTKLSENMEPPSFMSLM